MTGEARMRAAVVRLLAAARARGIEEPWPPEQPGIGIGAVVDAVRPLRLPVEVVMFWRLLDPAGVAPVPMPAFTTLDFALQTWHDHVSSPGLSPRLLFPIGYESHGFLFVELDDGVRPGGAVFRHGYDDEGFVLLTHSLTDYVLRLAQAWEEGWYDEETLPDGRVWRQVREDAFDKACAEALAAAPAHPVHGRRTRVPSDPAAWPEHWVAAEHLHVPVRGVPARGVPLRSLSA